MYNPIQPTKIFEQIAAQIEQRILSGELRSGDRLPTERALSVQFQVSRAAVREALKTLEQKGLVEMKPGRGTVVIDATPQVMRRSLDLMMKVNRVSEANDLVEIREILEPEIAVRAALRAQEHDIAALQEAVRVMDASLDNADAYISADNGFHRTLAKGTQNTFMVILLDSIVDLLSEQRKHIFSVEGGPERGQIYHKALVDAIINRDVERARTCMQEHLQQVRSDAESAVFRENK